MGLQHKVCLKSDESCVINFSKLTLKLWGWYVCIITLNVPLCKAVHVGRKVSSDVDAHNDLLKIEKEYTLLYIK